MRQRGDGVIDKTGMTLTEFTTVARNRTNGKEMRCVVPWSLTFVIFLFTDMYTR